MSQTSVVSKGICTQHLGTHEVMLLAASKAKLRPFPTWSMESVGAVWLLNRAVVMSAIPSSACVIPCVMLATRIDPAASLRDEVSELDPQAMTEY